MNIQIAVKVTATCLRALAQSPSQGVSVQALSKRCRVPVDKCMAIMQQLERVGIVSISDEGQLRLLRRATELSAFKILSALLGAGGSETKLVRWSNIERLLGQSVPSGTEGRN